MNKIKYIIINTLLATMGYALWQAWKDKRKKDASFEVEDFEDFIGEPAPIIDRTEEDIEDLEDIEDDDLEGFPEEGIEGLEDIEDDDLEGFPEEGIEGLEDIEDDDLEGFPEEDIEGLEDIEDDGLEEESSSRGLGDDELAEVSIEGLEDIEDDDLEGFPEEDIEDDSLEEESSSRGLGDDELAEVSIEGLEDIEDDDLEGFPEEGIEDDGLEELPEASIEDLEDIEDDDLESFPEEDIEDDGLEELPEASIEDLEDIEDDDLEGFPEEGVEVDASLPWHIGEYFIPQMWADTKGEGVKVAVLDSGICLTHPDLSFQKIKDFTTENGDAKDTDGHGTHCAGIICAKETEGVVGIAPKCELYVAKIAESDFDVTNDRVKAALKWAIQEIEVDIVMMSFSLRRRNDDIENLLANAKDRVIFVGAASKFLYPSTYTACIGVADIDKNQDPNSSFDRYKAVDIAAPGIGVHSTFKGSDYKTDSGSSMATAYVAGVLALLKSYADKENMDILPEKYAQILEKTATETPDFKIIQPLAALTHLKQLRIT